MFLKGKESSAWQNKMSQVTLNEKTSLVEVCQASWW